MKVGESEAGRGEGVNIRCVVGLASVASGVSISEVVGNDEHAPPAEQAAMVRRLKWR